MVDFCRGSPCRKNLAIPPFCGFYVPLVVPLLFVGWEWCSWWSVTMVLLGDFKRGIALFMEILIGVYPFSVEGVPGINVFFPIHVILYNVIYLS